MIINNLMINFNYSNVRTDYFNAKFGISIVPIFTAVYQKDRMNSNLFLKDRESINSISSYFKLYKEQLEDVLKSINELLRTQEEIIIWGAGCVAMELLSRTDLKDCNIKAFVDKDTGKHGGFLAGKLIYSPEILHNFNGTIVICAALYAADIMGEMKKMGIGNKTLILK